MGFDFGRAEQQLDKMIDLQMIMLNPQKKYCLTENGKVVVNIAFSFVDNFVRHTDFDKIVSKNFQVEHYRTINESLDMSPDLKPQQRLNKIRDLVLKNIGVFLSLKISLKILGTIKIYFDIFLQSLSHH